jgi:hypothetical protein
MENIIFFITIFVESENFGYDSFNVASYDIKISFLMSNKFHYAKNKIQIA